MPCGETEENDTVMFEETMDMHKETVLFRRLYVLYYIMDQYHVKTFGNHLGTGVAHEITEDELPFLS